LWKVMAAHHWVYDFDHLWLTTQRPKSAREPPLEYECFDTVDWATGRASGL